MKKKILPLLMAAALTLGMSSCSGEAGQKAPEEAETTAAPEETEQTAAADETEQTSAAEEPEKTDWEAIAPDTVVAYVAGNDAFNITFGDFYSEYKYYLLTYNIEDDSDPQYADTCLSYRSSIITYLQYENIFLAVAEEEGVGVSSLTKDDLDEIQKNAGSAYETMLSNYYSEAAALFGSDATAAQIREKEEKLLKKALEGAGLSDDIFYKWERNDFIQKRLLEKVSEGAAVTEEQVDEMYKEYVQKAKDAFEESPISYESNNVYPQLYVPEGTRLADQILLIFDDETMAAIREARSTGDNDKADEIRAQAYEEQLKEKTEAVIALIEAGNDFDELQEIYNADGTNEPYAVVPGSQMYVSEFTDAIFSISGIGGISAPAVSDYGAHIIKYAGDKQIDGEQTETVRKSMEDYLLYQAQVDLQGAAYNEWLSRYAYTTDYELLRIEKPAGNAQ